MITVLLVAVGGAIGAPLRFIIDGELRRILRDRWPIGTVVVNVVGSLLLGVVARYVTDGVVHGGVPGRDAGSSAITGPGAMAGPGAITGPGAGAGLGAEVAGAEWILALVGTGLCGALTTFSTYSHDALMLLTRRAWFGAAIYLVGTVVVGIAAFSIGWALG